MGKSPAIPPTIWKNPRGGGGGLAIPGRQFHHLFNSDLHDLRAFDVAFQLVRRKEVRRGAVFPAGDRDWQIGFAGGNEPAVGRIDLA